MPLLDQQPPAVGVLFPHVLCCDMAATRYVTSQSKTLVDLMKSKYTPYLSTATSRQATLSSFAQTREEDDGSGNQEEDSEREDDANTESQ